MIQRSTVLGLAAVLAAGLSLTAHAACTKFGADDAGCIPPDAPKGPITKCEVSVGKKVGSLVAKIGACHLKRAAGKLADDTAEDACEQAAITKFTATKLKGCDACTNLATISTLIEGAVDDNNGLVYCAEGTAFGGDDSGSLPPDGPKGPVAKCELVVAKAVKKLIVSELECHAKRAVGKLADDTAEDACEAAAVTKFQATKTTGCDACTNLASITSAVETTVETGNGNVFCAGSAAPAFVDPLP